MARRSALACCQLVHGLDIIPRVGGLGHWVMPAKVLSACMVASEAAGSAPCWLVGIILLHLGISLDILGKNK